ncbi:MAG TPA: hypothetical protein VJ576_16515 [Rhodocyclaceae bacterium]|nr:hypothetical protein [Rhodocyclaceae bacterium]
MEKVFIGLVLVTLGYGVGLLHGALDVADSFESAYACDSIRGGFECRNR